MSAALRAANVSILLLLGAAAVSGTGAATIGTGLTQPSVSGLPMLLAGTPVSPTHRRLFDNIFTTKDALETAVQAYDADVASAEATYGPIADWDVSAVSDMSYLFHFLQNFNADISSWDTSGVTNMRAMFDGAKAFNQPLTFDTSSVTNMRAMFGVNVFGSAFNQPLSFDTSNVTDMSAMFKGSGFGTTAFNQPLSLDTSSVTDMRWMFWQATSFNQSLSIDTSSVTDMSAMFMQAYAFNQPLSLDTSSVTDMSQMFFAAGAFNQPLSFDVSSITDKYSFSLMFDHTSLSDANRALIGCVWAGNQAFEDSKAPRYPSDPSKWPSIACQDGLPSYSDDSQSSCNGGCMGGIIVGCGVLVLMCTGWLSGAFAKSGCPSPFKKPTGLGWGWRPNGHWMPDSNRDSTTSKPTTSAV